LKHEIENIYTLTPLQEGMLFYSLLDPQSRAYFEQLSFTLQGQIDISIFEKSFNMLIERYEVLRTVFLFKESEQPLQVVLRKVHTSLHVADITGLKHDEQHHAILQFKEQDKKNGFDLQKDVLIRLALLQTGPQVYKAVMSFPHIIMDGWCLGIVATELFGIYSAMEQENPVPLNDKYPYSDYIAWLVKQDQEKSLQYWSDYLMDFEDQTLVPMQHKSVAEQGFEYRRHSFCFSKEVSRGLEKLAIDHQVTLSTVFHVMWGILMQKYNHIDDVVFGTVVSGRPSEVPGIEDMVGLFINTVPLRMTVSKGTLFSTLLQDVHAAMVEANLNSHVSLADIQSLTALKQHLIQHIVVFENYPLESSLIDDSGGGNKISISDFEMEEHANYDFDVTVVPQEELEVQFTYNGLLYEELYIRRIEGHLLQMANHILEDAQIEVSDIDILTEKEKTRILQEFQSSEPDYILDQTVIQLFEEQVRIRPQAIAIQFMGTHMTYDELNSEANYLARWLVNQGIQRGDFVGIMMDRSPLMLKSIIAIWKAGAAYIPLDVHYPEERIVSIMEDSNAVMLLTESDCGSESLKQRYGTKWVEIDTYSKYFRQENAGNLNLPVELQDLAYCLFTSGSTGQPKGVMIEHLGMLNHILAEKDALGLSNQLIFAQNANHCFDISVWQFICALALGGTTIIIPDEIVLAPQQFIERIQTDMVTLLEVVPSYLSVLMDLIEQQSINLRHLEFLMITGETVTPAIVRRWFSLCPHIPMINAYGPAEASDDVCQYRLDHSPDGVEQISIGRPLSNIQIYIVDQHMRLCPEGITGEICVSGISVGRGYLNQPEKTWEVFKEDSFALQPGVRLYKTGDLGRWHQDGQIEFAGRRDHQVKIRGFRIELGEIESHLSSYSNIREAAAVAWQENGDTFLYAYFTSDQELHEDEIKSHLGRFLPEYMIPAHCIRLAEIPLNTNGKIDRKKLPRPDINAKPVWVGPRHSTDELLCGIWKEVLGQQRTGIQDNFFNCGGHSLKAIIMVSKIYNQLNVNVSVRDIFRLPTIQELSDYITKLTQSIIEPIPVVVTQAYYPASSTQKRMYVLYELEDHHSVAYNMSVAYLVKGEMDWEQFEQAVQALIRRHEMLRTQFEMVNGEIVQRVLLDAQFHIQRTDLSESPEMIDNVIQSFVRPFNLDQAPLLRIEVIQTGDKEYILLVDMHHIISDGLTGQIIVKELIDLYQKKSLPSLTIQYKDYAIWQQKRLTGDVMKEHEAYWMQQFNGEIPLLNLPLDYRRPARQSFSGRTISFTTGRELAKQLQVLSVQQGSTLFNVLLTAYHVMLSKYSGQHDIVIGTPVTGRNHPELHNMIGMFVNTIALRIISSQDLTFRKLLKEVTDHTLQAIEHQDYPFEQLVDRIDVTRDTSRNPLFDTMFNLFDAEDHEILLDTISIVPYQLDNDVAKFDLLIDAYEDEANICFDLQYCTDLFKEETAMQMSEYYLWILTELVSNLDATLGGISLISDTEKHRIIQQSNGKKVAYDFSRNVAERFEKHAADCPDRVAVIFENTRLSYGYLNQRANQLASYLQKHGFGQEKIAAVMLDRTPRFMESVLAIWKVGGAYVPVDPAYGSARQENILLDSGADVWITTTEHLQAGHADFFKGEIVYLDLIEGELLTESTDNVNIPVDIHSLSYILFTSGSTGKPKGVMIEHLGMLNHILAEAGELGLDEGLVFAQNANQCFDISVWQFFGPLALGGTTVIYSNNLILDVESFIQHIDEDGVTLLEVVPTYLSVMMDVIEMRNYSLPSLQSLIITGEAVKPEMVKRWFQLCKRIPMINAYGPAEASDDSIQYMMKEPPKDAQLIPIGRPIANMNTYIVDEMMCLCPVGVIGEICVAGIGVGRGYIHDPERTRASFMIDPFAAESGQRLYRTGDMGRWLPDGSVEFHGRQDYQVKIRGFRIELEEIEAVLLQQHSIKEAVVMALDDDKGHPYLCAYVTMTVTIDLHALRVELSNLLPDYMIPPFFVCLNSMPLLDNGKIDRKSLPEPDRNVAAGNVVIEPTDEMEGLLVEIWQEVLGISKVGTNHNFFELGGDSIKAIQISSKLSSRGFQLKIKYLFQYPQISLLSKWVKHEVRVIDQGIVEGEILLTPIQHWFFENNFVHAHHWNQSVMLFNPEGFDANKVHQVWSHIMIHHDALRMVYDIEGDSIRQFNRGKDVPVLEFEIIDVSDTGDAICEINRAVEETQSGIELSTGSLIKLTLFHTNQGDHLFIVIHHLVIDGISWRILFEDFTTGYMQLVRNEEIVYPSKTDSYKRWAEELHKFANSKAIAREIPYWSQIENMAVQSLPKDVTGMDIRVKHNRNYFFQLSKNETDLLMGPAHTAYGTEMNDLLLTGLGIAIQKWAGHDQVVIALEGHGREEMMETINISRTVGWFTSVYPVGIDMSGSHNMALLIKRVKENLRRIPTKGAGYGILKYLTMEENKRGLTFSIKPEIKFNYLGQFDTDVNTEIFQVSPLSRGMNESSEGDREVALNISGLIESGELHISIEYNANEFGDASMARLSDEFKEGLSQIIKHCTTKEGMELTPSDVGHDDLSIEELDEILMFYSNKD
jgi:amino acid adenylation domain-containing protein/non-ribosomal peptide synthase protein (TIGR01720 family)